MKHIKNYNLFESETQRGGVAMIEISYANRSQSDKIGSYLVSLSDMERSLIIEDEDDGVIEQMVYLISEFMKEIYGDGPYSISELRSQELKDAMDQDYQSLDRWDFGAHLDIVVTPTVISENSLPPVSSNPIYLTDILDSEPGSEEIKTVENVWVSLPDIIKARVYRPEFEWVNQGERRKLDAIKAYQGFKGMI